MLFIVIVLCLILIIAVFTGRKNKSLSKGDLGEQHVADACMARLNNDYILFNNVTLRDQQQSTTQIDHILVSPYGIFVIETKNYSGWIYANEYDSQWTQKFPNSSYSFQNPLHQNYRHIQVLNQLIHPIVNIQQIHSIVVFGDGCDFKTPLPKHVFQGDAWLDYITEIHDVVFSKAQVKQIKNMIQHGQLQPSLRTQREHIKNVKARIKQQKSA